MRYYTSRPVSEAAITLTPVVANPLFITSIDEFLRAQGFVFEAIRQGDYTFERYNIGTSPIDFLYRKNGESLIAFIGNKVYFFSWYDGYEEGDEEKRWIPEIVIDHPETAEEFISIFKK